MFAPRAGSAPHPASGVIPFEGISGSDFGSTTCHPHSSNFHPDTMNDTLVLINCSAFNAFDDALSEAGGCERTILTQSLGECLATKATSTIGKRLSSMTKFASFCESKGLKAFPLSEKCLHAYMSELHSNKQTSASAGKSFLESVRFSAAKLGLHGLDKDRVPQRVSGLAELLATGSTALIPRTWRGSAACQRFGIRPGMRHENKKWP